MRGRTKRFARQFWRECVSPAHYSVSVPHRGPFRIENRDPDGLLDELRGRNLKGPSLMADNVTDYGTAGFVADPFLFVTDEELHLFFEVYNQYRDPTASIGHAVSRDHGCSWKYTGIVLREDRHLSFPYVFEANGEKYLLPDQENSEQGVSPVRLYRAVDFPRKWEQIGDLFDDGRKYLDTVLFPFEDRWWAIVGTGSNDELRVYYSDELLSDTWTSHPENPVVVDRRSAGRPAGRPIVRDAGLFMFYQDCENEYGTAVRAYQITELSPHGFDDQPLFDTPLLEGTGGVGWNSGRMHHLDVQWNDGEVYCAVDGDIGIGRNQLSGSMWSIGIGTSHQ